jgi:hypothetical protein
MAEYCVIEIDGQLNPVGCVKSYFDDFDEAVSRVDYLCESDGRWYAVFSSDLKRLLYCWQVCF